jgi:formylglycine-generating enzyme required for sulfatase activity
MSSKPIGFLVFSAVVLAAAAIYFVMQARTPVTTPEAPTSANDPSAPVEVQDPQPADPTSPDPADADPDPQGVPEDPDEPVDPERAFEKETIRGDTLTTEKKFAEAVEAYDRALALKDDDGVRAKRDNALRLQEKAERSARIKETREQAKALLAKGKEQEAAGDLDGALLMYNEGLALNNPLTNSQFSNAIRSVEFKRNGAKVEYEKLVAEARGHLDAGETLAAADAAQQALAFMPGGEEALAIVANAIDRIKVGDMVHIPAGPSMIGDPQQSVDVAAFEMDTHPVTNREFLLFVRSEGHSVPTSWGDGAVSYPEGRADHPVTGVTFFDAAAYAAWAGKRLPTAEEWEKACRYIDGRRYSWGNGIPETNAPANCSEFGLNDTTPVGQFPRSASPYKTYDMIGNVWEWTSTERTMANGQDARVLKGGSFAFSIHLLHAALELPEEPSLAMPDIGFRCVRDLEQD